MYICGTYVRCDFITPTHSCIAFSLYVWHGDGRGPNWQRNEMLKNADKAKNLASAANFEFGLSEKEVLGEAFQLRN
jgi:hypothetical protein